MMNHFIWLLLSLGSYLFPSEEFKQTYIMPLRNSFVERKIVGNISDSKADLEIRFYIIGRWRAKNTGTVISYKFKGDHVSGEKNDYIIKTGEKNILVNQTNGFKRVYSDDTSFVYVKRSTRSFTEEKNHILTLIRESNAYTLNDQSNLEATLIKENRVKPLPCETLEECMFPTIIVEIKSAQKTRNFSIVHSTYFHYFPNIEEYKRANFLNTLINLY